MGEFLWFGTRCSAVVGLKPKGFQSISCPSMSRTSRISTGASRTQAKGLSVDLVSKHESDFTDLNRGESDSSQRAFSRSRVQARVRLHGSQQVRVGLKPKGFQSISCP